jgi:hypothetical protein
MGPARPPRPFAHPITPASGARTAAVPQVRWSCRRSTFGPHAVKDRSLSCATNTLVNPCQGRRFAQAALKSCGSLEQPRDLGTCPTFMSDCRACGLSHIEAAYIEAAYIEAAYIEAA